MKQHDKYITYSPYKDPEFELCVCGHKKIAHGSTDIKIYPYHDYPKTVDFGCINCPLEWEKVKSVEGTFKEKRKECKRFIPMIYLSYESNKR